MIATKNAVELCVLIVESVYGELSSRLFAALAQRGRLTVPMLANQTGLTTKHIQHGLVVLIRQGLIYHYEEPNGITFYESNLDAAYSLIRVGKVLDIIETRSGQVAKEVTEILLSLGHATAGDIADEHHKRETEKAERDQAHKEMTEDEAGDHENAHMDGVEQNGQQLTNGVSNGASNGHDSTSLDDWHTSGKMDEALWDLLEARLIEPVTENMFTSIDDIYKQQEKILINRDYGGSITGIKAKAELNERMRDRLREIRDQGREAPRRRYKRGTNGLHVNGDVKRRKTEYGGRANDVVEDFEKVDRDLVVRVNHEQCLVALRSRKLAELAGRDIHKTTGEIYGEFLRLAEKYIARCRPDPRMDDMDGDRDTFTITTMELDSHMDKSIPVSKGIGKYSSEDVADSNGTTPTAGHKRTYDKVHSDDEENYQEPVTNGFKSVNQDDSLASSPAKSSKVSFAHSVNESENRSTRLIDLNKHLALLADHRRAFLTKTGNNERGEWTVDFPRLSEYMLNTEIDTNLYNFFGNEGRRLCQILRQMGKLDEPTLEKRALMPKKDMQQKLTEMQRVGYVDIQEVPRDNLRITARTMFLWYFDHERTASVELDRIYKAMARCLEVLDVQKLGYKEVLQIVERTDVVGYEEEMLDPRSLTLWKDWLRKQEVMWTAIGRLDDLVSIFKDF